ARCRGGAGRAHGGPGRSRAGRRGPRPGGAGTAGSRASPGGDAPRRIMGRSPGGRAGIAGPRGSRQALPPPRPGGPRPLRGGHGPPGDGSTRECGPGGAVMIGSLAHLADVVLVRMQVGILAYFVLVNGFYGVLLFAAIPELVHRIHLMRGETSWRILSSGVAPKVTILAPAHNEAATVGESVRALL